MHPLDGARERLKRADENIQNLNREIIEFLSPVPVVNLEGFDPVITDKDRGAFDQLTEFVKKTGVDLRFSVLAGEVIHHLRSAFDHLAWQLSSSDFQAQFPERIEFPVFQHRPDLCGITKKKMCRYCRKVEGISSASALTRIETLQPYNRTNPTRHPLWLIHDMDRIDKHRALVLAVHIMKVNIRANTWIHGFGHQMPWERTPRPVLLGEPEMEVKIQMSAQITFSEFSGRDDESIIPTLQNFLRFTIDAIDSFAKEFA